MFVPASDFEQGAVGHPEFERSSPSHVLSFSRLVADHDRLRVVETLDLIEQVQHQSFSCILSFKIILLTLQCSQR
jgi:hypothetical protein